MSSYGIGFLIGTILVGSLLVWIGSKGFTQRGIPITKKYALKGWAGKIIGIVLIVWGSFNIIRGIASVVGL